MSSTCGGAAAIRRLVRQLVKDCQGDFRSEDQTSAASGRRCQHSVTDQGCGTGKGHGRKAVIALAASALSSHDGLAGCALSLMGAIANLSTSVSINILRYDFHQGAAAAPVCKRTPSPQPDWKGAHMRLKEYISHKRQQERNIVLGYKSIEGKP
ncbi:hypothetical protein NDU88_001868 [Pleurodeles waltl]|uniref:Uncharacterized protein n=1 Tax=Pleurodeles waltl TaxID=8319 RepID=A0AAV7M2D4_PLEWA|nr:hypothetical protein NDU88_001868 [Pleurodeles waltl]